jgi:hypothetical protein
MLQAPPDALMASPDYSDSRCRAGPSRNSHALACCRNGGPPKPDFVIQQPANQRFRQRELARQRVR